MERRTFLQSSLTAGGLVAMPVLANTADAATEKGGREFFELRTYALKPDKQAILDRYFSASLIPALNRLGIKQVGAFYERPVPSSPIAHLLIPYQSLEQMATINASLAVAPEYLRSASDYLAIPATDPVYDRIESSLLSAFETMPKLETPAKRASLYNLRIYESHNEAASKKKIEMFNKGEIEIFRRTGLTPVLFGEAILGTRIPNLTYLLAFDDEAARVEAWNKFRSDPEWFKLKSIPEYEDKRIVSKITNKLLTPAEYSQI